MAKRSADKGSVDLNPGVIANGTDPQLLRAREDDLYRHVTRLTHKIKKTFYWAHSVSTGDMVNVLIRRWVKNGEWDRLANLEGPRRIIGTSVKRNLIDEFRRQKREVEKQDANSAALHAVAMNALEAMTDDQILDGIELARICDWCLQRIEELREGLWDERVRALEMPLDVMLLGNVLHATILGQDADATAKELGIDEGSVGELLEKGQAYLVILRHAHEQAPTAPT
jgi:DNA-directed RNA polymerase specialized sigma24 family protein